VRFGTQSKDLAVGICSSVYCDIVSRDVKCGHLNTLVLPGLSVFNLVLSQKIQADRAQLCLPINMMFTPSCYCIIAKLFSENYQGYAHILTEKTGFP
jgi:hypothetical protein